MAVAPRRAGHHGHLALSGRGGPQSGVRAPAQAVPALAQAVLTPAKLRRPPRLVAGAGVAAVLGVSSPIPE